MLASGQKKFLTPPPLGGPPWPGGVEPKFWSKIFFFDFRVPKALKRVFRLIRQKKIFDPPLRWVAPRLGHGYICLLIERKMVTSAGYRQTRVNTYDQCDCELWVSYRGPSDTYACLSNERW